MPVYSSHPHYTSNNQQPVRTKRRQVKNACTHCQKACKKCDDARPCLRCIKYGHGDECVSSQRKPRKKGVKRGPYKKRDGRDRAARTVATSTRSKRGVAVVNSAPPPPAASLPDPYLSIGYPQGYYPQCPQVITKSPDAVNIYPPQPQQSYFVVPGHQLHQHPAPHIHHSQTPPDLTQSQQYPSHPQSYYQNHLFPTVHYHYPNHPQDLDAPGSSVAQYTSYPPSNYTKATATINPQSGSNGMA